MPRKLICRTLVDANTLRARIQRFRPGRSFSIYPVVTKAGDPAGHQVVEVKRVGWWAPSPIGPSMELLRQIAAGEPTNTKPQIDLVTVQLPFLFESKCYVDVTVGGTRKSFGKTVIVGYQVVGGDVRITLPAKVAAKRGLLELAA